MTDTRPQLRDLLHRLYRLHASEGWADDLNPTQRAALAYLARANRFSRAPSHVADYLLATRGTVSQTLKALHRKGLIRDVRSETDRRSISYELAEGGERLARTQDAWDDALAALPDAVAASLGSGLSDLARGMLERRGGRSFGICRTCRHHDPRGPGGYCRLLEVDLAPSETGQLCHEHAQVQAA